jgi:hypothetical protein
MNRKQLRVRQARLGRVATRGVGSVRTRGMEAVGEVQHRMRMKLRKADLSWVSSRRRATPDIQSRQICTGDGGGTKTFIPDPVRTPRVRDLAVGSTATWDRCLPWVERGVVGSPRIRLRNRVMPVELRG